MQNEYIRAEALTKSFRSRGNKVLALDKLGFVLHDHAVNILVGMNGSGKTTCLKILMDLLLQDSGTITFAKGKPSQLGFLFDTNQTFYPRLGIQENLEYFFRIKTGRAATPQEMRRILEDVSLFDKRNAPCQTLSRGMRTRLGIAVALIGNPDFIVLDEPTLGLDLDSVADLQTLILGLKTQGKCVLVATHQLDFAKHIGDHLIVIEKGQLVAQTNLSVVDTKTQRHYDLEYVNGAGQTVKARVAANSKAELMQALAQEDVVQLKSLQDTEDNLEDFIRQVRAAKP